MERRMAAGDYARGVNVGDGERIASAVGGGALAVLGLRQGGLVGWALALLGGALASRGLTGHCRVWEAAGIDRAPHGEGEVLGNLGVKLEKAVVVNAPAEALYRVWRHLENLPRFMSHVESVTVLDATRSRWRVKAPGGTTVEWEARIINDKPGQLLAWETSEDARVRHAGAVNFEPAPGGGTRVRVSLQYAPPGGKLSHGLAALVGEDAGTRMEQDLARFKRAMEAGELAA